MSKLVTFLTISIAALSILAAVSPALVALANAAVPLVIVAGVVAAVLRLVVFHTRRW